MYLGSTLYRIHGSNEPQTIGHAVSSGCIRLTNEDVIDLYDRVPIGTKVVVLANDRHAARSDEQTGVAIDAGHAATMLARITPTAAEPSQPRTVLTSNPTPFGLY